MRAAVMHAANCPSPPFHACRLRAGHCGGDTLIWLASGARARYRTNLDLPR